jgi:outer membrane protein assembly factor BamB
MRHGHVRRESLLYVVVAATRPRYCGVLLVAALWLSAGLLCPGQLAAQKTKHTPPPPPFAALFPLEEAWTITLPALPAAPAAHDGARVFVPLASRALAAFDWQRGDELWSVPLAVTATPLPADGVIYVGAGDALRVLDGATGAERWSTGAAGTILALARTGGGQIVAAGAGFVQAFDETRGKAIWSRTLPPSGDVTGVALSDVTAFVAYAEGRVVALALADGRDVWVRPIDGRPAPPLVHADSLYVGSTNNRFYALDVKDGDVRWSWRTGGDIVGAGADTNAVYYTSLDAVVRAVNPGNGHQRWKRDGGTRAVSAPLVLDGSLLVAGLSPSLSGFDPLTGVPQGTFELPGDIHGAPLVAGVLVPRTVSVAVVLKDGRAFGLRSLSLMFNENAPQPLLALPGTPLTRERLP